MGIGMRHALRGLGVCGGAFLLFAALALWHPLGASAATLTVTNTNDTTLSGDGVSLREAVNSINGGTDVDGDVTATRTGGYGVNDTIVFQNGFSGTITLTGGTLTLTQNITITGPGADRLAIDGGCTGCDQPVAALPTDGTTVFVVNGGVTAAIDGLAVRHGFSTAFSFAGGIVNHGTLALVGTTVSANVAAFCDHCAAGLYNDGALSVASGTISFNTVRTPSLFTAVGILSAAGTLGATDVTIAGNTSDFAPFALSGLLITGGAGAATNATIAANGTADGGAAGTLGGTLTLTNTIVAGNTGLVCPDIRGPLVSGGHNLIGDTTCGTGITDGVNGDIVTPAPLISSLGNNGGPTQTVLLKPASPALDNALCTGTGIPTVDQRGVPRPQGIGCDIGAYESQTADIATITALTVTPTATTPTIPVTLTAVVTAATGSATPTGSVTFTDNGTPLATIGLGPTGTASLFTQSFAIGNHPLAALYSGQPFSSGQIGFVASTGTTTLAVAPIVLVVNNATDGPEDATRCLQGNANTCRLRDAIAAVNTGAASGTAITFAPALFPAVGPLKAIVLLAAVGPLNLNASMTITGPGATALAIDGGCTANCGTPTAVGGTTIANVGSNGESAPIVTISDLTIQNGNGPADSNNGGGGGGINNTGTLHVARVIFRANTGVNGGALTNSADAQSNSPGILTVADSTFAGNAAVILPNNGPAGLGGAIANAGTATVTNSTFTMNTAQGAGGAIANVGAATVTNSTIQGNNAPDGGAVASLVGFPGVTPQVTLVNATLSGNTAQRGGGIDTGALTIPTGAAKAVAKRNRSPFARAGAGPAALPTQTVTLTNTLVAGNAGGDIGNDGNPVIVTADHSLIGDGTGGIAAGNGNLLGTVGAPLAPLLGPLGTYGSANGTQTLALLPGSVAIDAGTTGGAVPASDQRGKGRVGAPDIGAFESQGFTLTPAAAGTPQSAVVGTLFINPLALTVTANNAGEPVQGGIVIFTPPASGASAVLTGSPATIGAGGQVGATATANGIKGSYTVTASATGVTMAAIFSLTNTAPLVSIAVAPAAATLKVGQVQQLTATGSYADSSTADLTGQVTWSSDAPTVASVDATGKATGKTAGTTHITATQGAVSGQTTVTVSPPILTGVQPAPAPASRPGGASVPTVPGTPAPLPIPSGSPTSGSSAPVAAPTGR